jgi:hypothetical protein
MVAGHGWWVPIYDEISSQSIERAHVVLPPVVPAGALASLALCAERIC